MNKPATNAAGNMDKKDDKPATNAAGNMDKKN
jgi:hypothetical protein